VASRSPAGNCDARLRRRTGVNFARRNPRIAANRAAGNTAVREVMSERVYYCFDKDDVEDAAKLMAEHQTTKNATTRDLFRCSQSSRDREAYPCCCRP
jgi:CBS domain-containing protein